MVVQLCEYIKSHWIVHFKWVNGMVYESCLSKLLFKKSQFPFLQNKVWRRALPTYTFSPGTTCVHMSPSFWQYAKYTICWWPWAGQIQACLINGSILLEGRPLWPRFCSLMCWLHKNNSFQQNTQYSQKSHSLYWHTRSLCPLTPAHT